MCRTVGPIILHLLWREQVPGFRNGQHWLAPTPLKIPRGESNLRRALEGMAFRSGVGEC